MDAVLATSQEDMSTNLLCEVINNMLLATPEHRLNLANNHSCTQVVQPLIQSRKSHSLTINQLHCTLHEKWCCRLRSQELHKELTPPSYHLHVYKELPRIKLHNWSVQVIYACLSSNGSPTLFVLEMELALLQTTRLGSPTLNCKPYFGLCK